MEKSWKRSWLRLWQLRAGRIRAGRTDARARVVRPFVEGLENRTMPSVLMVTNTQDTSVAGAGSLRGEILAAHNGDTIQFSSTLTGMTITLTKEIAVNANLTIQGPAAGKLAVSGSGSRLFEIASGATVTIEGLTLEKGIASGSIARKTTGQGGAILDHGTLTLQSDAITGNLAQGSAGGAGQGGAVYVDSAATLTMLGDTVTHNTAAGAGNTGRGGALFFAGGSTGTLAGDALKSNTAAGLAAVAAQGGGVFATGTRLSIKFSIISNNLATGLSNDGGTCMGGGLFLNGGTVSITQSTIAGNAAAGAGGGTGAAGAAGAGAVGGNGGGGVGGGLYASATAASTLTLSADSLFQNTACGGQGGIGGQSATAGGSGGRGGDGLGGAIAVEPGGFTLNLTNDTLAANIALGGAGGSGGTGPAQHGGAGGAGGNGRGGGIWAGGGTIQLLNDTIAGSSTLSAAAPTAGNSATGGSGGFASAGNGAQGSGGAGVGGGLFESGTAVMTIKNTIVANNAAANAAPDVSGSFTAHDHNLIGNARGSKSFGGSDLIGVDPHLTAMGFHGGTTQTMVPLGGPAVDGGDDSGAPAKDQRGVTRPQGSHVDIGAVEVANLTLALVSGNSQTATHGTNFTQPLVVALTENGQPVAGVIVDFTVIPGTSTGAAAILNQTRVTTDAKGQASATVTANSNPGTFSIKAQVNGLIVPAQLFVLTNL